VPSPQPPVHGPQSVGQVVHVSPTVPGPPGEHMPSPHVPMHGPQSAGQLKQLSPPPIGPPEQAPSPQTLVPSIVQNAEQPSPETTLPSSHSSPASMMASPHVPPHEPQSAGQVVHVSPTVPGPPGEHVPSPHVLMQGPQSEGQVKHDSIIAASHTMLKLQTAMGGPAHAAPLTARAPVAQRTARAAQESVRRMMPPGFRAE
jgi:hypothetical protein